MSKIEFLEDDINEEVRDINAKQLDLGKIILIAIY